MLLTAVLLSLAAYEYAYPGDDGHQAGPLWLNAPLTVLFLLPLAWRRAAPWASFLIAHAVVAVPSLVVDHTLFAFSGMFVLGIYLYTVARHCDIRLARWAPLVTLLSTSVFAARAPAVLDVGNLIFAVMLYGTAWAAGRVMRRHALTQEALTAALERLAREQEQRERLAVLDERANLARDLHDVVAHAVALMLVQAGAARLALDDNADEARQGLRAVEEIGREAIGDLRRLLGLLRATESGEHLLEVMPGLDQLPGLIAQMSRAGLDARMSEVGECPEIPPSLSMFAFRIVQEALTNTLKHAGPTSVFVRLDYRRCLSIEIVDDGPRSPRPAVPSGGHGLLGMQERVALYGGSLRLDHRDDGFAVRAELPFPQVLT